MKLVYVAGPFRSMNQNGKSNAWGVQSNIMAAMKLALEVWKLGHAALCPHANTMFFQDADGCADEVWLDGDLEMLSRCDAMILTPDWEKSSGARRERLEAINQGKPVFYNIEELGVWLAEGADTL
jgi:hypothetical protein